MVGISLITNMEGQGADVPPGKMRFDEHTNLTIGRLPRGMESGRDSVMIRLDMPNGEVIVAQCTMRQFLMVADAFKALPDLSV